MWKCPHCETKLDQLKYSVGTVSTEYGDATLTDTRPESQTNRTDMVDDHNHCDDGDTDWDGSPNYECPECDREVGLNELVWFDDEEESETSTTATIEENPNTDTVKSDWKRVFMESSNNFGGQNANEDKIMNNCLICPRCAYFFARSHGNDETAVCPECNKAFDIKQSLRNVENRLGRGLRILKVATKITIKKHVKRI